MRTGVISVVQTGSLTAIVCRRCGSDHALTAVLYGLTDQGPVELGDLVSCDGCETYRWGCARCGRVLDADGDEVFDHIATEHTWTTR